MKKILLIALGFLATVSYAQQKTEIPATVLKKFETMFPGAKIDKWEKKKYGYRVSYELNKIDTKAKFDSTGNLVEKKEKLKATDLPKAAQDYITSKHTGMKAEKVARLTDAKGTVTFEAELKDRDIVFDASGNFVSEKLKNSNPEKKKKDEKK
jgi:hypothetical protein